MFFDLSPLSNSNRQLTGKAGPLKSTPMFNKFYDALYLQLITLLSFVRSSNVDPVKCLSAALSEISAVLFQLREKVLSLPFPTSEIEILFFKTIKPKFVTLKIFHFELYGLDMNRPSGSKDVLILHYNKELGFIERFFSLHAPLYDYYRTGRTEMDHLYFVRSAEIPSVMIPEMPENDPLYGTPMDYLFAKFMAFEQLRAEIVHRIGLLDGSVEDGLTSALPELSLKWTGKIVNLGELIYGLYYTGQLNHGNAQLSEITALFERMFSVKIRDVHHTFGEIRERKVSSPSKFIDSMAMAIRDRVEEDLKYKPARS